MKKMASIALLLAAVIALSGCGHQIKDINRSWNRMWNGEDSPPQKEYDSPSIAAPAKSKFAQIQLGMDYQQVWSLVGMPTSFGQTAIYVYIQHESNIDKERVHAAPRTVEFAFYKGLGTVIYASHKDMAISRTKEVIKVTYNPDETGFRPVAFYEEGFKHNSVLLSP